MIIQGLVMKKLNVCQNIPQISVGRKSNYRSFFDPLSVRRIFWVLVSLLGFVQSGFGNMAYNSLIIKTDGSLWAFGQLMGGLVTTAAVLSLAFSQNGLSHASVRSFSCLRLIEEVS